MERLAARLARKLHRGQVDKAGKDYFEGHLSTVGNNGADWKEKTVGFLHDAAEDTGHTVGGIVGMLREMVSDSHEEICHRPSEDDWNEITEALELMNSRTAPDRQAYIERFRGHGLAIRVKLTDMRHNMDLSRIPHPTPNDLARLERYRKEYAALEGMLASLESR